MGALAKTGNPRRPGALLQDVRHLGDAGFGAAVVDFLSRPRTADASNRFVAHLNRYTATQRQRNVALPGTRLIAFCG